MRDCNFECTRGVYQQFGGTEDFDVTGSNDIEKQSNYIVYNLDRRSGCRLLNYQVLVYTFLSL